MSFWEKKLELGLANFQCKKSFFSFFPGDLPACFLHKELDNLALPRLVDVPSMFVDTYFQPAFQHLH